MFDIQALERLLGYEFKNKELLRTAMTHPSYSHIHGGDNYQRLEFLGDSILDFLVAEELCKRFDKEKYHEGELTKMRGAVVSASPLSKIVQEKGYDKYLNIGAINVSEKVRSDVFESLCAAIYLDSGIDKSREFVLSNLEELIKVADTIRNEDYKSQLNEKYPKSNIEFKDVAKTGEEHNPIFEVELYIDGTLVANARGKKKKLAQQECARIALEGK
ncbi:MAG: ribonuclease III [Clostridiales bacterium]|nr:ribonuclease III [Clostridiales bacterium]